MVDDHGARPSNIQEDSSSFGKPMEVNKVFMVSEILLNEMLVKNIDLQNWLDVLVEQYYQQKLAYILTVNCTGQLEVERLRVNHNYSHHNRERVFGLTS